MINTSVFLSARVAIFKSGLLLKERWPSGSAVISPGLWKVKSRYKQQPFHSISIQFRFIHVNMEQHLSCTFSGSMKDTSIHHEVKFYVRFCSICRIHLNRMLQKTYLIIILKLNTPIMLI